MDTLRNFYLNTVQRDAVKEFLEGHVRQLAVEKALKRESTAEIADCIEVINNAFTQLEEDYGEKKKKVIDNQAE